MLKRFILAIAAFIAAIPSALAHCPLCTAATGAAVVASRYYGLPDSIVGVFIGTFALSTGLWTHNLLKKRRWEMPYQAWILSFASIVLTIVSLQIGKLFQGSALMLGMPSLLTGMLLGTGTSAVGYGAHHAVRKYNDGKNLVPLQGLIAVLASMVMTVIVIGVTR